MTGNALDWKGVAVFLQFTGVTSSEPKGSGSQLSTTARIAIVLVVPRFISFNLYVFHRSLSGWRPCGKFKDLTHTKLKVGGCRSGAEVLVS